jgi:hypothetical protein
MTFERDVEGEQAIIRAMMYLNDMNARCEDLWLRLHYLEAWEFLFYGDYLLEETK